jgi:hypothetical protein
VFLVELLGYNLLSVSQLCHMRYNCLFTNIDVSVFRRSDGSLAFKGVLDAKLYLVDFSKENVVPTPTVGSAISRRRVDFANGRKVTPDCLVCHRTVRYATSVVAATVSFARKGRKSRTVQCSVLHRIVWCAHGQKATMAFQMELQQLLAALGL